MREDFTVWSVKDFHFLCSFFIFTHNFGSKPATNYAQISMNPDEKTPVETLAESQTQCVGAALSATRYGILFDSHDQRRIEVSLNGHRVVGGGYTGDLQCTGLTHWCEHLTYDRC